MARKIRHTASGVPYPLRDKVAERDSYTCIFCTNGYTDLHHLKPRSQGGRNVEHNLICTCRRCHSIIGGHVEEAYYRTRSGETLKEAYEQRAVEYISDYYAEFIESGEIDPRDWA